MTDQALVNALVGATTPAEIQAAIDAHTPRTAILKEVSAGGSPGTFVLHPTGDANLLVQNATNQQQIHAATPVTDASTHAHTGILSQAASSQASQHLNHVAGEVSKMDQGLAAAQAELARRATLPSSHPEHLPAANFAQLNGALKVERDAVPAIQTALTGSRKDFHPNFANAVPGATPPAATNGTGAAAVKPKFEEPHHVAGTDLAKLNLKPANLAPIEVANPIGQANRALGVVGTGAFYGEKKMSFLGREAAKLKANFKISGFDKDGKAIAAGLGSQLVRGTVTGAGLLIFGDGIIKLGKSGGLLTRNKDESGQEITPNFAVSLAEAAAGAALAYGAAMGFRSGLHKAGGIYGLSV